MAPTRKKGRTNSKLCGSSLCTVCRKDLPPECDGGLQAKTGKCRVRLHISCSVSCSGASGISIPSMLAVCYYLV